MTSVTQASTLEPPAKAAARPAPQAPRPARNPRGYQLALIALVGTFIWSYWPNFVQLVHVWQTEPDYSHGFIVAPLALYFLWARRATRPRWKGGSIWGLVLIAASVALRVASERFFLVEFASWSMIPWIAGVVLLLCGWRILFWSTPAILFLIFMMKLPLRWETMLSSPLRRVATQASGFVLQCLGLPALPEGNTIVLGDQRLEVAEACAGMRMCIGVLALVFAYLVLANRPWWQKLMLCLAAPLVAVAANVTRISVTGLVYQFVDSELAHKFSHDFAGWMMVPVAMTFFVIILWFLDHSFVKLPAAGSTRLATR